MFICGMWKKVKEGPMDKRRTLILRCNLEEGHEEERHCDKVLLVDFDDKDCDPEAKSVNEWKLYDS